MNKTVKKKSSKSNTWWFFCCCFFCMETIITPKWIAFIIYTFWAFFVHMTNTSYYTDQSRFWITLKQSGEKDVSWLQQLYQRVSVQRRAILKYCSVYQLMVYCIVHFSARYITSALLLLLQEQLIHVSAGLPIGWPKLATLCDSHNQHVMWASSVRWAGDVWTRARK